MKQFSKWLIENKIHMKVELNPDRYDHFMAYIPSAYKVDVGIADTIDGAVLNLVEMLRGKTLRIKEQQGIYREMRVPNILF